MAKADSGNLWRMLFNFRRQYRAPVSGGTFSPCWLRRFGRFTLIAAAALTLHAYSSFSASAAEVTLAWDRSPEASVSAYKLYYGTTSRGYSASVTVTNATTARLTGLTTGTKYYFAVTARTSAGLESDYSTEVSQVAGSAPDIGTPRTGALVMRLNSLQQPVLTGTMTAGASYDVLYTTRVGGAWATLGTVTASTNGAVTFTDPTKAGTQPSRFYRLRQK